MNLEFFIALFVDKHQSIIYPDSQSLYRDLLKARLFQERKDGGPAFVTREMDVAKAQTSQGISMGGGKSNDVGSFGRGIHHADIV